MGIKSLNKFIKIKCPNCISRINLKDLENKVIAIDTSIYLYRFASDDTLIENIYLMVSLFKQNNITPIFIFDGKPPEEKQNIICERQIKKTEAKIKYEDHKKKLENVLTEQERQDIEIEMLKLKKKFISIKNQQVRDVKELLTVLGISYYVAEGEADNICAWLTIKQNVYACLSDDMDLFVYGCPRIIRQYNIYKGTMILYETEKILNKLDVTQEEFKELCILSGTDYYSLYEDDINPNQRKKNVFYYYDMLMSYKKLNTNKKNFYEYVQKRDINEPNIDYKIFTSILNMFDVDKLKDIKEFIEKNKKIKIDIMNNFENKINHTRLIDILKKNWFILTN